MNCPACNFELTSQHEACENCGAPAYLISATQSTEIRHCHYCGARSHDQTASCTNCGLKRNYRTVETGIGTCRNCGTGWRNTWLFCQTCGVARENGLVEAAAPFILTFPPAVNAARQVLYAEQTLAASAPLPPLPTFAAESELAASSASASATAQWSESFGVPSAEPENAENDVDENDAVYPPESTEMSEAEVVGLMFGGGAGQVDNVTYGDFGQSYQGFDSDHVTAPTAPENTAPDNVIYALPQTTQHAEPLPQLDAGQSGMDFVPALNVVAPTALKDAAASPLNLTPPPLAVKPEEPAPSIISTPPSAVPPKPAPTQAVRKLPRPRKDVAPPVSTVLIKLIAVLIGLILIFAALIVSGVRLRDVFSWRKAAVPATTPATSVEAPVATETATPVSIPAGMVYVAGGNFQMGTDAGETYEAPAHEVNVKAFFIDRTEVTNAQYAAFVRETKHAAPSHWSGNTFPAGAENMPVVNVAWTDANDYAIWAGKRLPTEVEWEFAARGTDGRKYEWGNEWKEKLANTRESGLSHAVAVNSIAAPVSVFGTVDMTGNVWEWTASELLSYKDATIVLHPGMKVLRGGAFNVPAAQATTTFRGYSIPTAKKDSFGFRCVKDVE